MVIVHLNLTRPPARAPSTSHAAAVRPPARDPSASHAAVPSLCPRTPTPPCSLLHDHRRRPALVACHGGLPALAVACRGGLPTLAVTCRGGIAALSRAAAYTSALPALPALPLAPPLPTSPRFPSPSIQVGGSRRQHSGRSRGNAGEQSLIQLLKLIGC